MFVVEGTGGAAVLERESEDCKGFKSVSVKGRKWVEIDEALQSRWLEQGLSIGKRQEIKSLGSLVWLKHMEGKSRGKRVIRQIKETRERKQHREQAKGF